ncbi:Na(+)/H(+) antiporter subunit B [Aliiglaciecola sp. CAU 1673]|uniref:Na(+)/H(+) antiporter subunit B n=1 Tax=Aliiglaciecola sp. CAU 1673 TaxID=3032595 RepID=UPI0023D988FC|nr:Na(+)/H(+) antiporter subunit B [Aliiglaciecola sp. CAU 1673]MDF2179843.1 Na(+)/H(+) antiporter subunit B [Aliiglaciecola sp. CAU 1673]
MKSHLLLQVLARYLIPLILLFAFYVQFHGDFSPGGGFQAGAIFSAAMVFYLLAFGLPAAERVLPPSWLRILACFGLLLYAGTGLVDVLLGGEFLNYSVMAKTPLEGQHIGIILIEIGVGMTVASTLTLIFYAFAHWSRLP